MRANALLIGGTGFAGTHMQRLLAGDFNVFATGRTADIRDPRAMVDLVAIAKPDVVINFASVTTVRESFQDPLAAYGIGFLGTFNLLTALKKQGFKGRMLNISSSEVYGFPSSDQLPLREDAAFQPMSPYSVSKVAAEALCFQWSQTEQFAIVTARPFTHIGPGQSDRFAISNFAKQISEVLLEIREPTIRIGDIDTTRDFTDVRDVVCAYKSLLERGQNGHCYNVCSGKEISTRALLEALIEHAGVPIRLAQDETLLRRAEQRRTCGDNSKIQRATTWRPVVPLSTTVADVLSYWTNTLRKPAGQLPHNSI